MEPDCENCEYRKVLAKAYDCHVCKEDCPLYMDDKCTTRLQGDV